MIIKKLTKGTVCTVQKRTQWNFSNGHLALGLDKTFGDL